MDILFKNCTVVAWENEAFKCIRNGFLGVRGDTIDYVGDTVPADSYAEERDMDGAILMPGLINTHTHAAMTLLRGVGSGCALQEWLFDKIFPVEDKLTEDDIEAGVNLAMLEMLASGTTSFSDMYFFPWREVPTVAASGMKANISRPVQCFDPSLAPQDNAMVRQAAELYDNFNNSADGRIAVDYCIHAEYTCNDATTKYLSDMVKEKRGNLHIHLSETQSEQAECIERHGLTPAAWFESLGAFDSSAFAAHCVAVTDEDIEILRRNSVAVVHNPTSNMKLGSGFAPLRKLIDSGITVGLGTDGAASNNNLNMFEEMHLAAVIHNGYSRSAVEIKPEEILKMATVNGAAIQHRNDTGCIAAGKKADITAVSVKAPHMRPDTDTIALLVYSAQASDVVMTMVDGKILYDNGRYLTLDSEKIYAAAEASAKHLGVI